MLHAYTKIDRGRKSIQSHTVAYSHVRERRHRSAQQRFVVAFMENGPSGVSCAGPMWQGCCVPVDVYRLAGELTTAITLVARLRMGVMRGAMEKGA